VDCVSLTLVVVTSKAEVSVWGTVETNARAAGQNHAEVIATRKLLDKILEGKKDNVEDIVKMELLICPCTPPPEVTDMQCCPACKGALTSIFQKHQTKNPHINLSCIGQFQYPQN
jgi:hypothetical protein